MSKKSETYHINQIRGIAKVKQRFCNYFPVKKHKK